MKYPDLIQNIIFRISTTKPIHSIKRYDNAMTSLYSITRERLCLSLILMCAVLTLISTRSSIDMT